MRSGHENYQTLYATNDVTTGDFTVNRLGAPNDSTVMVSWIYNLGEKPIIETKNIKVFNPAQNKKKKTSPKDVFSNIKLCN